MRWFLSKWIVVVEVNQKSFLIGLKKSKFAKGEWIVQVGPVNAPLGYSEEILLICREIHAVLTAAAGITAIRWYFEGFHNQSAAVTAPDQLPWTQASTGTRS
jgi:hypothetical protein